jgi:tRNA-specific 2-thiouridylase
MSWSARILASNRLVLGWDEPATPGLYADRCVVGSLAEQSGVFDREMRIEAQPRYRARAEPVLMRPAGEGKVELVFDRPQRALAAGQVCGFYDGSEDVGRRGFRAR